MRAGRDTCRMAALAGEQAELWCSAEPGHREPPQSLFLWVAQGLSMVTKCYRQQIPVPLEVTSLIKLGSTCGDVEVWGSVWSHPFIGHSDCVTLFPPSSPGAYRSWMLLVPQISTWQPMGSGEEVPWLQPEKLKICTLFLYYQSSCDKRYIPGNCLFLIPFSQIIFYTKKKKMGSLSTFFFKITNRN